MDYTYNLLNEGKYLLNLTHYENVTLVMGKTGTGKTALTLFIAGDNSNLFAKEVTEGSGDYVIIDSDNKISQESTIISKTLFPDVIINDERNAVFIDCPGFSDTRNASVDIVNSYILHEMTNQVKAVKILFTVNYPSVKEGVDRNAFLTFLKHATRFIKDIDELSPSIALAVTKVDNIMIKRGKEYKPVHDRIVTKSVVSFLKNVKNSLDVLAEGSEDKLFYKKAKDLIDVFLTSENGIYTRIGLFRRPTEEGSLIDMPELQEEKEAFEKILYENVIFTQITSDDFGFTISPESLNHIYLLVENINSEIPKHFSSIAKEAITFLGEYENSPKKEVGTMEYFKKLVQSFEKHWDTLGSNPTISSAVQALTEIFSPLKIPSLPFSMHTDKLLDNEHFIGFLQLVSESSLPFNHIAWYSPIEDLKQVISKQSYLHETIEDIYFKLSSYYLQTPKGYNARNALLTQMKKWTSSPLAEGVLFQEISPFIKALVDSQDLRNSSGMINNVLKDYMLAPSNLKVINTYISITTPVKNEEFIMSDGKTILVVTGNFLKTSDIKLSKRCDILMVLSTTKLFIDRDFECPGCIMVLVSPTWEIIGERKINLDGEPGSINLTPRTGLDGNPGLPGGPGGHFLGIGGHFINDEKLLISVKGGNGGYGQDGLRGSDGRDGKDADVQSYSITRDSNFMFTLIYNRIDTYYQSEGELGSPGERGGHGGAGGRGGHSGKVMLIGTSRAPKVKYFVGEGAKGIDGKGGPGGHGGKDGDNQTGQYYDKYILFMEFDWGWKKVRTVKNFNYQPSGEDGVDGKNVEGINSPMNLFASRNTIFDIIAKYSHYSQNLMNLCHSRADKNYIPTCGDFSESPMQLKSVIEFLASIPSSPETNVFRKKRNVYSPSPLRPEISYLGRQVTFMPPALSPTQTEGMLGDQNMKLIGRDHRPEMTKNNFPVSGFNDTLILIDLLIKKYRMENGKEYSKVSHSKRTTESDFTAHDLAYSYYKPK